MTKHRWMLASFMLGGMVLGIATLRTARATPIPTPATSSTLYPIHRFEKPYPLVEGLKSCDRIEFTVDKSGTPRDFRVWAHYLLRDHGYKVGTDWLIPNKFDRFTFRSLSRWRFRPRRKNGKRIATNHVIYNTFYAGISNFFSLSTFSVLPWLCTLPPMHGVPIHSVDRAGKTSRVPTIVAFNAVNGKKLSLGPAYVSVNMASMPKVAKAATVWLRFCVNVAGLPSDVTLVQSKSKMAYARVARYALDQISFPVLKIRNKKVPLCGLGVRVRFRAHDSKRGDVIGLVGPIIAIGKLTHASPEPKLEEEKPTPLSVKIPPKMKLPPVAKVEVRFCIDLDGGVSEVDVVHANPPQIFDRAAIETVKNWRFKRPSEEMCDVYEKVRFPLKSR